MNFTRSSLLSAAVVFVVLGFFTLPACSKEKKTDTKTKGKGSTVTKASGESEATIETKFGKIVLKFREDVAPKTVENFRKLAKKGFYDKTTFHRVIPGFMIQGGDPNSKDDDRSNDGMGGPGYTIDAEFSKEKHKRGAVSMARSSDPNSAGSQFFIVVKDSTFLDGQYTIFGEVKDGMDVADKIVGVPRDSRDNPLEKVEMTKVSVK